MSPFRLVEKGEARQEAVGERLFKLVFWQPGNEFSFVILHEMLLLRGLFRCIENLIPDGGLVCDGATGFKFNAPPIAAGASPFCAAADLGLGRVPVKFPIP